MTHGDFPQPPDPLTMRLEEFKADPKRAYAATASGQAVIVTDEAGEVRMRLGARFDYVDEAEEIAALRRQLDEARAEAADLRVRLQRAHGALAVWRESDPARAFRNQYDYQKLLEETRPDGASGTRLLVELHVLRNANKGDPR
jgi:hypothetical protein